MPRLRRSGQSRDIHERGEPKIVSPAHRQQALGNERAIEPLERHHIGGCLLVFRIDARRIGARRFEGVRGRVRARIGYRRRRRGGLADARAHARRRRRDARQGQRQLLSSLYRPRGGINARLTRDDHGPNRRGAENRHHGEHPKKLQAGCFSPNGACFFCIELTRVERHC